MYLIAREIEILILYNRHSCGIDILILSSLIICYCIEQNFGGEKTLTNLANRHNSPSFFANIPDEACGHAVCVVNVRHLKQDT